ncbi:MAG: S-layer homology domain-containing protein [Selenomonadaceae bacterium]|nr:S-layer homology domain-containing protein [Selenomonadaceae bacterium]
MAVMVSKLISNNGKTTGAMPFSDVPAGHWASKFVKTLATKGINEGYGDGTFRGDRNITRYEAAMMLAKALVSM